MMLVGQKITPSLYSSPAVRFVLLFLITGIIMTSLLNSVATKEDDTGLRIFKDGHVIIGGIVFLHDYRCDKFSPWNLGIVEAYIYAIEKINKDKILLPNLTLGYDIRDSCGKKIIAARQAFRFASASTMNCKALRCVSHQNCICTVSGTFDKTKPSKNFSSTLPVIAIVGMLPSRVAIPLANFLQAVRMPYVESSATSEELSSSLYGSFFRTIPSDANQAKAFADIIEHFGWRYVAVVAGDNSYGRHGVLALERESFQRGLTFCVELFGYIPLLDYNNKLQMIVSSLRLRKTVRVIILWSGSFYAKEMLRVAVKEGLKNRVWIFSESLASKTPEYLSSIHSFSSTGIHIGVKIQSKAPENFRAHLERRLARNHSNQGHYLWKEFWEYMASTSRSQSSSELLDITYDDYAIYVIDAVYSIAHALDRMFRCKGSAFRNKEFFPINKETIKAGELVEYLKNVTFRGATGKVQFDTRGDPVEAIYEIIYFNISRINKNERITKDIIGYWFRKSNKHRISIVDAIQWKNEENERKIPASTCTDGCKPGQWKVATAGCCWKCLRCIYGSVSETNGALSCTKCTKTQMSNIQRTHCIPLPITNIYWSDILAIILIIISILGIIIDMCVFGILYYFRDTPMVRALNKVCTLVLLLGIAFCFAMTLLYVVRPSSGLCSVQKPLRYVVYTLCCSALFLKTMQIVHAFNISQHPWIKSFICSTKRQVIVLLVMICIDMLLGAVWILKDPPYAHVTIVPKSHVVITCVPFKGTLGKVLDSLMLVYLVFVAGCCISYAYRARNLPSNFNEAKHISFSLYIFMLSWITYYPVDYAVEGWYVAVLSGATLLLSSYGLLGCIFGPKLFIIVLHPEKNTVEFIRAEMRHTKVMQPGNCTAMSSVTPVEASRTS